MGLPKIIAVVGTNASGKSSIGIELAKKFNGEIISADSRQIYRGFDLCCGKVSAEEAKAVPHHLLDIREIGDPFSAFDFQQMTCSLIPQILDRGRTPFIVGGTGLYVRSVVEGYLFSDRAPDIELRNKLEKLPLEELQTMLTPEGRACFASKPSDFQNKPRVIHALEKIAHGEPLEPQKAAKYDALQLGVTWPKEQLYKRIEDRLESRIRSGMIDEVRVYLENGGSQEQLEKLGLEYRYTLRYLTGEYQTLDEFKLILAQKIRQFAKRQMSWYRKDASIHWLNMNSDYFEEACSLISKFLVCQSE